MLLHGLHDGEELVRQHGDIVKDDLQEGTGNRKLAMSKPDPDHQPHMGPWREDRPCPSKITIRGSLVRVQETGNNGESAEAACEDRDTKCEGCAGTPCGVSREGWGRGWAQEPPPVCFGLLNFTLAHPEGSSVPSDRKPQETVWS